MRLGLTVGRVVDFLAQLKPYKLRIYGGSIYYKYKQSLFQMNWDCRLFMRTSLDEKLPIHDKLPVKNLNTSIQKVQNPFTQNQKPLKPKNKQNDKSREFKKKMSLKSKSNSIHKNYEPHYEYKENVFNQQPNFCAPTERTHYDKNHKQSRLRTESSYSNTANPYFESFPFYQGNSTSRQIEFAPPCLNSPSFKARIKKNVSLNNIQYNQPNAGKPYMKITPFCEMPSTTRMSVNALTVNELKKFKPVVTINNQEVKDNFQRVEHHLSVKNIVYLNGREVINKNIEKKATKIDEQKPVLNCLQKSKAQKSLEQNHKEGKKQKIEDFLNSKQLTKSVRDSGQLSQQQQCSRVVVTYGQILKEHGKFHLDS